VVSGKGGTGKTSVVAALAVQAGRLVIADCDVDASNLHLVLEPTVRQRHEFSGGKRARIVPELCSACGACEEVCRFDAVERRASGPRGDELAYIIRPLSCQGCGVCAWACPTGAIAFEPMVNGEWYLSDSRVGPMLHAHLEAGAENSGKLVTVIRQRARGLAGEEMVDLLLVDGPPGVGCPVIAALSGADAALIVAEPTAAGYHDFERIADLAAHFEIPAALCINKCDLDAEVARRLEATAAERQIPCLAHIRYDRAFGRAQRQRQTVVELEPQTGAAADLRELWQNLQPLVANSEHTLPVL